MTSPLRDLAATRPAALCLDRRGRPRGLTFDDHLVRGALVLDLALCGAPTHTEEAVELDHQRAAAHGLATVAAEADEGGSSLLDWLDRGAGELVVDRLTELGVRMRAVGRAVD